MIHWLMFNGICSSISAISCREIILYIKFLNYKTLKVTYVEGGGTLSFNNNYIN
jgi:hypothetical protein